MSMFRRDLFPNFLKDKCRSQSSQEFTFISLPIVSGAVKPAACLQRKGRLGTVMQVFRLEFKRQISIIF